MKGRISAEKKNRWLLRGVGDERFGDEKRASTEGGRKRMEKERVK